MATQTAAAQAVQNAAGSQTTSRPWLESLTMQMFILGVSIVATILAIVTLQGIEEEQSGEYPCRSYDYLEVLPKISTSLILIVAVYFLYLAWVERKRQPNNRLLTWLLFANIFAVGAAVIKADATYQPRQTAVDIEEEVE